MERSLKRDEREKSPGLQTFSMPSNTVYNSQNSSVVGMDAVMLDVSSSAQKSPYIITPGGNAIPISAPRRKGPSESSAVMHHSYNDSRMNSLNPSLYGPPSSLTGAATGLMMDRYNVDNTYSASVPVAGARFGGVATSPLNYGVQGSYRRTGATSQPQPIWQSSTSNSSASIGAMPGSFGSYRTASSYEGSEFGSFGVDAQRQIEILNDKRRRRRESHNAVERRRRDNINDRIIDLDGMIPADNVDPAQRANKGQVLKRAVHYVRQLQNHIRNSAERTILLETALRRLMEQRKLTLEDLGLPLETFADNTAHLTEKVLNHFLSPMPQSMPSHASSAQLFAVKPPGSGKSLPRSASQSSSNSFQISNFPNLSFQQQQPSPQPSDPIMAATGGKNNDMVLKALLGYVNIDAQGVSSSPSGRNGFAGPQHTLEGRNLDPGNPKAVGNQGEGVKLESRSALNSNSSKWSPKAIENQHFLDSVLSNQLFGMDPSQSSLHEDMLNANDKERQLQFIKKRDGSESVQPSTSLPNTTPLRVRSDVEEDELDEDDDDFDDDALEDLHYQSGHTDDGGALSKLGSGGAKDRPVAPPFVSDLTGSHGNVAALLALDRGARKDGTLPFNSIHHSSSPSHPNVNESSEIYDFKEKNGRYLGDSMLLE